VPSRTADVHIDGLSERGDRFPSSGSVTASGIRTFLATPLYERVRIGVIAMRRTEVALLRHADRAPESFADQAVIAIENVRLFTELEAGTATSLRLWSNRPPPRDPAGDQPFPDRRAAVFDAILAARYACVTACSGLSTVRR
jgi:GAF domain-containing protein